MKRLPEKLRRFIAAQITSVEELEILFLLSNDPIRPWTPKSVFKVIQSSEDSILSRLTRMVRQGFAKTVGKDEYEYAPASDEIAQSVAALRTAYKQSRVPVIEAIFSERMDPGARFSDSFRIEREN